MTGLRQALQRLVRVRGRVTLVTRPARKRGSGSYRLIQYDSFTRKLLSGCNSNKSPMSPRKLCVPSTPVDPRRPWLHTTKSVDPGRYSHLKTTFERNCLKLNPPMLFVYAVSAYAW